MRVPLIFSCPGTVKEGIISSALVELQDIPATLLEFSGLNVPEHYHGQSLLPILTGKAPPDVHRDFVRAEYYDALDVPPKSLGTMYRDERYKLNCFHGHDVGELFDMQNDPMEFHSLWDEPAMQPLKCDLLKKSFDATVVHSYWGLERIGPM